MTALNEKWEVCSHDGDDEAIEEIFDKKPSLFSSVRSLMHSICLWSFYVPVLLFQDALHMGVAILIISGIHWVCNRCIFQGHTELFFTDLCGLSSESEVEYISDDGWEFEASGEEYSITCDEDCEGDTYEIESRYSSTQHVDNGIPTDPATASLMYLSYEDIGFPKIKPTRSYNAERSWRVLMKDRGELVIQCNSSDKNMDMKNNKCKTERICFKSRSRYVI